MIQFDPRYEALFKSYILDEDCDGIAQLMRVETDMMKDAQDAGLYNQTVTMYL